MLRSQSLHKRPKGLHIGVTFKDSIPFFSGVDNHLGRDPCSNVTFFKALLILAEGLYQWIIRIKADAFAISANKNRTVFLGGCSRNP